MCRLLGKKKKFCFLFYLVARWGRLDAEGICRRYKEFQNMHQVARRDPPSVLVKFAACKLLANLC